MQHEHMAPAAPRLLVVEDDDTVRVGLHAALTASGYEVRSAVNGIDIDRTVEDFRPDAAVLDVALGCDPDGLWIGRHIRDAYGVAVVFLTAADSVDDRLLGFDAGADDYIIKPFSMAEL